MLEPDPRSHPSFPSLSAQITSTSISNLHDLRSRHPSLNPLHFVTASFVLTFLSSQVLFQDPIWAAYSHGLIISRLYSAYASAVLPHLDAATSPT